MVGQAYSLNSGPGRAKSMRVTKLPPMAGAIQLDIEPPSYLQVFMDVNIDENSKEQFAGSNTFEIGSGLVIILAAVLLGLEADRTDAPWFLKAGENFVTAYFLGEWCLRLQVHGFTWIVSPMNLLDTFIVWGPGVATVWVLEPFWPTMDTEFIRALRIGRMFRLARIVQVFKHIPAFVDLWSLLRSLMSSGKLLSAVFLVFFAMYVFTIVAIYLVTGADWSGADAESLAAREKFVGVLTAMLTLSRFVYFDHAQDVLDELHKQDPWAWVLIWSFAALTAFILLNLVTAVIVQQAMERIAEDEKEITQELELQREVELKEFEMMFTDMDEDGNGLLELHEFQEAFGQRVFQEKLALLGLKETHMVKLFNLLDADGNGSLTLQELMDGLSTMSGPAKSKDMVLLEKNVERCGYLLEGIDGSAIPIVGSLEPGSERGEMLSARLQEIRDRLDVRLTTAETEVKSLADYLGQLADAATGKGELPEAPFDDESIDMASMSSTSTEGRRSKKKKKVKRQPVADKEPDRPLELADRPERRVMTNMGVQTPTNAGTQTAFVGVTDSWIQGDDLDAAPNFANPGDALQALPPAPAEPPTNTVPDDEPEVVPLVPMFFTPKR